MNTAHELRMYCDARRLRCQPCGMGPHGEQRGNYGTGESGNERQLTLPAARGRGEASALSRGTSHCIIAQDAARRANDRA
jgi:hypothetical protein